MFPKKSLSWQYVLVLLIILFTTTPRAMGITMSPLGPDAKISLLTCSPGEEVWAHYGHTAIRVNDPENHRDYTFNYGVFDFNTSNFLWKFVSGQTDYILGVSNSYRFIESYREENRCIHEQILNLTPSEKERLWVALYTNALPENRTYRYNFFYDNCATRARIIIENAIEGDSLVYDTTAVYGSMRDIIRYYTLNHPWAWFGISLAVSSPADKPAPYKDQWFAPELMMNAFTQAQIIEAGQDSIRPLVASTQTLTQIDSQLEPTKSWWEKIFTPSIVCWLLFVLTVCIEIKEIRQRKRHAVLDGFIFGIAGLLGLIIAFLAFVSIHPAVQPNYLLFWLQPLHLIFAIALCFPAFRKSKLSYAYLKINFPVLLFALIGIWFLPQYFHPALIPLMLILLSRSIFGFSYLKYPVKKK